MTHRDLRPNTPVWLLGKIAGGAFYRLYLRMRVEGEDEVPSEGALVLVSNHLSNLDPFAIGIACHRPISFIAKQELFKVPILATCIRGWGAISIDRHATDMAAMRVATRVLRDGKILGIFPEGTRSRTGDLQAFREGVAKIALRFNVPVVPVAVIGTNRALPRGAVFPRPVSITVRFGPPFLLETPSERRLDASAHSAAAEVVRQRVARLIER